MNPLDDIRKRLDSLRREVEALARREVLKPIAGTWSPVITSSNGDFATSYTTQDGRYTRLGDVVVFSFNVVIGTISSAGTGVTRVSLPFTAAASAPSAMHLVGVDVDSTAVYMQFNIVTGNAFGSPTGVNDNAAAVVLAIGGLANGDTLRASGVFFV